ncbi:MAG: Xaa-Pro peptidase family protein [Gemmatimonadaceae bacterium]
MNRIASNVIASLSIIVASATTLSAQIPDSEFGARRTALAASIKDGIVVALGSPEPEQDYITFNQNSPFIYLTGFLEPDASLVMVVKNGVIVGTPMLFVRPSEPSREVWTGHRLGVPNVKSALGLDGRAAGSLNAALDSLILADPSAELQVVGSYKPDDAVMSPDDQVIAAVLKRHPGTTARPASAAVAQLRRVKTAGELDFIRRAVNITVGAQKDAMRLMEPGINEFEIQATIDYDFRRNGADRPSFSTIVGSGPNSTTLHYSANDRFIEKNDMIVMDIGASFRGYAADVTRTVPASGTFSPVQRDIYSAVRAAQAAGEKAGVVNGSGRAMTDSANASLDRSLSQLGLIQGIGATYDCDASGRQCSQRSLYYMHGLGHGIGLDVHDPGASSSNGTLVPGSAFTIEPGIYVRANLLEILPNTPKNAAMIAKIRPAVQKYANIGVRIEDDYIVTPTGIEWISRAPREIADVEAMMKEKWTGPSPRDASTVEAYRSTGRHVP